MRKFLTLILASTFITAMPVVAKPVEAATLFERLFPRAAERRRQRNEQRRVRRERLFRQQQLQLRQERRRLRQERRKQRRLVLRGNNGGGSKPANIKAPTYKTYVAPVLKPVRLSKLSKAFSAAEQKALASSVLARQAHIDDHISKRKYSLDAYAKVAQGVTKPAMRLSAGWALLNSISIKADKKKSKAITAHYTKSPRFMWVDEQGQPSQQARDVMAVLEDAESYGLRAQDYAIPDFPVGQSADEQTALRQAMQFEFSLTAAALRYLVDARHGRIDPNRISGYHDFSKNYANAAKILDGLAGATSPDAYLLAAHPSDKSFEMLRAELKTLRENQTDVEAVTIAPGTFIKPGQTHAELANVVESIRRKASAELRQKHFIVLASDHASGLYTDEVVALVKDFQSSVKLRPDGIIGRKTIARMIADDPSLRLDKVLMAMERLRWHPDQLGATHVFINQPAYNATYYRDGQRHLSMRTVVGKASNQTSFFHDTIDYVEYNPYWGIPRSILVNEMLPKLRRDPSYFDRLGYEVTTQGGRRISSSNVDWWSVGANFPFNVRQPPGQKNALGELKIMFPNKHAIYMHDTPARSLFKREARAFSHGCVRLAEPRKMAAAVLGTTVNSIANRIAGGQNNTQTLKAKVPVYVAYFTAWPGADGKVEYFRDIYGRDAALTRAMKAVNAARERALSA